MHAIFLDESGQLSQNSDQEYFVVGSFMTSDPRKTAKQFRSWQQSRFPRSMRYQSEVKFSDNSIDNKLRLKTIQYISHLDIFIQYTYLSIKNIPENFFKKNRLLSGHLYTEIVGLTLDRYTSIVDSQVVAVCDKRHLQGVRQSDFKIILETRLQAQLPVTTDVQVDMLDSQYNPNIQIADWITGAIASYINNKSFGEEYFVLLNNTGMSGRELFKNSWRKIGI